MIKSQLLILYTFSLKNPKTTIISINLIALQQSLIGFIRNLILLIIHH